MRSLCASLRCLAVVPAVSLRNVGGVTALSLRCLGADAALSLRCLRYVSAFGRRCLDVERIREQSSVSDRSPSHASAVVRKQAHISTSQCYRSHVRACNSRQTRAFSSAFGRLRASSSAGPAKQSRTRARALERCRAPSSANQCLPAYPGAFERTHAPSGVATRNPAYSSAGTVITAPASEFNCRRALSGAFERGQSYDSALEHSSRLLTSASPGARLRTDASAFKRHRARFRAPRSVPSGAFKGKRIQAQAHASAVKRILAPSCAFMGFRSLVATSSALERIPARSSAFQRVQAHSSASSASKRSQAHASAFKRIHDPSSACWR